jgi:hypothetical protein
LLLHEWIGANDKQPPREAVMRTQLVSTVVLALLAGVTQAQTAARPEKPQVTLGADIKQLLFNWEPVAGATYYQLYVLYPGTRHFVPQGERLPATQTQLALPLALHLHNWERTFYIIGACNSAGCTSSTGMNPRPVLLDAIGYLKASNFEPDDTFGGNVVLSSDGYTLAVTAPGEASSATGVGGNQADNGAPFSGAVYVFRRRGNEWEQEAYIKAGVSKQGLGFGSSVISSDHAVALSGDGSILAAAAPYEKVGGAVTGTVYIYRRFRNTWTMVQKLSPPAPKDNSFFGFSIDMSRDARTIKVSSIDYSRTQDLNYPYVYTHIYVKGETRWERATTLEPFYAGDKCQAARLDALGQTLVSACFDEANGAARIVTMKGAGATWVHADDLPLGARAREPIAINGDATWLAVRHRQEPPVFVHLYRWTAGQWIQAAAIPPIPSLDPHGTYGWGWLNAISDDGRLLAIGDSTANEVGAGVSATPKIAGIRDPLNIGAIYIYERGATPDSWTLRNVVKSRDPAHDTSFAIAMSLSASGRTLAVGAGYESGGAHRSGAVYLY